jgi:hypothetical protein
MKQKILVALLLCGASSLAEAASTVTVVTPATNTDLALEFRIETESLHDGIVRFDIFVSSGEVDISPHRDARFTVWGEHPKAPPEKGFGARVIADRPVSLSVSSVKERNLDGTLRYEVQVHQSLLSRVSLTFLNYEESGMPAFDGYEIMLGQFVTEER